MKKTLVAIAVGAAFAMPGAAFADVKVYGKFNVGLESFEVTGTDAKWVVQDQNNSSRLGVKGSEDIGIGDLKAVYQVEFGTNPDGDESNTVLTGVNGTDTDGDGQIDTVTGTSSKQERVLTQRNIFVGLKGGFGEVIVGKFDTPVKKAGEKVDQFNDESIGDDTNLLAGESRLNNLIQYTSPKFGEMFSFTAAFQPGEARAGFEDGEPEDGVADSFWAAAAYDTDMVYASLSYAGNEGSALKFDGGGTGVDILRGAVLVKPIVDLELGALYQQASAVKEGSDSEESSWLASVAYTLEAFKFKGQYGQTDGDTTDEKLNETAFGVDYKLSKAFVTQLYYVTYEQDLANKDTDAFGVGVVYSF